MSNEVSWGGYQNYEGPYFHGTVKYVPPASLTSADIALSVITATEGGHYDAINMYDRCVVSVGLIQFCEANQYSVSDLLGTIVVAAGGQVDSVPSLSACLPMAQADFRLNSRGRWRFFFNDAERGEVDRLSEQQQLFLLESTGQKGTWNDRSKAYAKFWAGALSQVLASPLAQKVQVEYTLPKLMGFVMPYALATIFRTQAGKMPTPVTDPWEGALRAGYLSFAANNPTYADNQARAFFANTMSLKSKDICIGMLRQLTFGPKIAIYPARYNAIRPVLEKSFGIDLPDFSEDLAKWQVALNINPSDGPEWRLDTALEIQKALIELGYELGPKGADGRMGPKTQQAIMAFQSQHGLDVDGVVGPKTRAALVGVLETRRK